MDQSTCATPSSTTIPRPIGPRPSLPARRVPLHARPLARELASQGWEQPQPTAYDQHVLGLVA